MPQTGLARVLARTEQVDAAGLAAAWHDQSLTLRLRGAGRRAPSDIGGHLRRSFLGALGKGASEASRNGQPCDWDPPCALDVFGREQLRGPRGDGLPKPYLLRAWAEGRDLMVTLRIFGMANDWALGAGEALAVGLREILPWSRVMPGMRDSPEIAARDFSVARIRPGRAPDRAVLVFLSPMDATGTDIAHRPQTLVARLIRRADALSRWNGVRLSDETGRALARHAATLDYDLTGLRFGHYQSPNRHRKKRRDPTIAGRFAMAGDLAPLWPILQIGTRCHIGRHAVEGLGAFRIEKN